MLDDPSQKLFGEGRGDSFFDSGVMIMLTGDGLESSMAAEAAVPASKNPKRKPQIIEEISN